MKSALLTALAASLSGRRKQVAGDVYPTLSQTSAESRLSRVLDGSLAIPAELLVQAIRGEGGEKLLGFLTSLRNRDAGELREEALTTLRRVEQQLSLAFDRLEQANHVEREDEERRAMRRVSPQTRDVKQRA